MISTQQFDRFLHAAQSLLPPAADWPQLSAYPNSLAECVIDAIWSERVRYSTVREIIDRYRAYRALQGADADVDGARELAASFAIGLEGWIEQIGNHQRAYSRGRAPYKAELVHLAAEAAVAAGVETAAQLRDGHTASSAPFRDLRRRWLELPSQHSGLTFERLLLVAGIETVPPDPWLEEFASKAVGAPMGDHATIALIEAAAKVMDVAPLLLRNAIWQYQNHYDQVKHTSPAGSNRVVAGSAAGDPLV
jgi:hypothetical protein